MKIRRNVLALSVTAALAVSSVTHAQSPRLDEGHAVFLMTNDALVNEVIAYARTEFGTLASPHKFKTGGRGSGGNGDPLASQGSLTLSQDKNWLFAVNAGSGTLSVFRVTDSSLILTDEVATEGAEPVSVTQNGNLVYVLNAAGSSSVMGFFFHGGHLARIDGSQRFLSANGANPGAVAFSPDGRFLLAVEKTGNDVDVFEVGADGTLSKISVNPSVGPGAFAVAVAPNGTAIVSETGGTTAAISSYSVHANGSLTTLSASVPTFGTANCWNAITPDGRFVYASNAGSSTIAGFAIGSGGVLTPLPGTVVGTNPAGSGNLDIAISANGKFLYSLNSASGAVGMFAINADGTLTDLGTVGGLPAGSSLNGIAAN
jgi:6-phosphogluconolactonase (cycloisomerase 2 family)